jgi:hypothetical protein
VYFRTKTIKGTPLLQLVESYRNAEGSPRQRVVASLGDAVIPEAEKDDIAGAVTRCLRGADRGESEDWFETTLSEHFFSDGRLGSNNEIGSIHSDRYA